MKNRLGIESLIASAYSLSFVLNKSQSKGTRGGFSLSFSLWSSLIVSSTPTLIENELDLGMLIGLGFF